VVQASGLKSGFPISRPGEHWMEL